jgi:hypothetical protein
MLVKLICCVSLPDTTILYSIPIYNFAEANEDLVMSIRSNIFQMTTLSIEKCPFCNAISMQQMMKSRLMILTLFQQNCTNAMELYTRA